MIAACLTALGQHDVPSPNRITAILRRHGSVSVTSGGVMALTVWLLRVGVTPGHGHPYYPKTQGEERFHRMVKVEMLVRQEWRPRRLPSGI